MFSSFDFDRRTGGPAEFTGTAKPTGRNQGERLTLTQQRHSLLICLDCQCYSTNSRAASESWRICPDGLIRGIFASERPRFDCRPGDELVDGVLADLARS